MSHIDLNVRMGLMKPLQAFRRCDDSHEFDLFSAVLFDKVYGRDCRSPGGQHGIRDNDGTLLDGAWKLAVILVRLMCYLIPIKTDMAYLCTGNQRQDAVYHAKARPQNRNHCQLPACDHRGHTGL